jgi:DeoR/GlpR family transcriptional regulator of sugar metabolism
MPVNARQERILNELERNGFASVVDLSSLLRVSEVTVRRDLEHLEIAGRLRRTHGGALSIRERSGEREFGNGGERQISSLADRVDVLVTTPVDPSFDRALLDRAAQRGVPVIAESVAMPGAITLVAPDNEQAAYALGQWAGYYVRERFDGRAYLLDLTFDLPNTRERSRGFLAGLREVAPEAHLVLSINSGSNQGASYQITRDVLAVHPEINVIFAINDATAIGARHACQEQGIPPDDLILLSFGLEGNTMRNALIAGGYCRAALAMFPEIVGPTCVEAAVLALDGRAAPPRLVTPAAVLTPETIGDFYARDGARWGCQWQGVQARYPLPLPLHREPAPRPRRATRRLGLVVPFSDHEWYASLAECMRSYAARYGMELEVIDAEASRQEDITVRQREIARMAAALVQAGDVVLIDAGPITTFLAEALADRPPITVITNSLGAIEALRDRPGITLIVTGGVLAHGSDALCGPTADGSLRDLRADKLFLSASGVTPEFGISHDSLAEVATKQAMIRVAREVILLADHTRFGAESVTQVAPLRVLSRVITDNALPATTRLELSKTGIEVIIART